MGRGFRPAQVRTQGHFAVVMGDRGTALVDVRTPGRLQLAARIETLESGAVSDALLLGGRLYLLGSRGLQVSDRSGDRLVSSVDVGSRSRLSGDGRHLALVGERGLQLVDTTAFVHSGARPAAR